MCVSVCVCEGEGEQEGEGVSESLSDICAQTLTSQGTKKETKGKAVMGYN